MRNNKILEFNSFLHIKKIEESVEAARSHDGMLHGTSIKTEVSATLATSSYIIIHLSFDEGGAIPPSSAL
jgi:hypothetical protein